MIRTVSSQRRRALRLWALSLLLAGSFSACAPLTQPQVKTDPIAAHALARLLHKNDGLTRFKCIAKVVLRHPERPAQSFRAAVAGRLPDHLRIDLFAAFGGSAGTLAGNGEHLFLVSHSSLEYHKRRFGGGSLSRLIHLDISVGDLLELMVGRVPTGDFLAVRWTHDSADHAACMALFDGWGTVRQRICFDAAGLPETAQWSDRKGQLTHSLRIRGQRMVDGFHLPKRIEMRDASGRGVSIALEHYEANAALKEDLFELAPPSS